MRKSHTLTALSFFPLVGTQFTPQTLISIPIVSRLLKLVRQRYSYYQLESWPPARELVQYLFSFLLLCVVILHTYTHIGVEPKAQGLLVPQP